jgi:hypothetical protein
MRPGDVTPHHQEERVQRGHSGFALVVALTFVGTFALALLGARVREQPAAIQADGQPTTVPDTLRAHLREERFSPLTTIGALPAGLRQGLQALFGGPTLDMAEPGARFQATDLMVMPRLPPRRLTAAGCSADHCLVYYERGGYAHVYYAALFKVSTDGTRFEFGGPAASGLPDLGAVKDALLAGKVVGQPTSKDW